MCKSLCLGDYRGHNSIAFRETIPHAVNTLPAAPAAAADRQPPPGRPSAQTASRRPAGRHRQTTSRRPAGHRQPTASRRPAGHHRQTASRRPADHHRQTASHHPTGTASTTPPPAPPAQHAGNPNAPATARDSKRAHTRKILYAPARRYCARDRQRLRVRKRKSFVGVNIFLGLPRPGDKK